ncbi:hypothetical protein [Marinicauda pacifica]|uniref:Uncharacterized protein n=1 Tax=Marinicauda pacifica TaxID=1133559 RepID=A0A4S2H9W6_9PROT|nr:hypothetical protein [Marinicauda pacifica]TGY92232.1 hypothetical protein E5162_11295 [Marinicauda pacifica]
MSEDLVTEVRLRRAFLGACVLAGALGAAAPAAAQTVGSVSGPEVRAGEREAEYRLGLAQDRAGDDVQTLHRAQIQTALNDRVRVRAIAVYRDRGDGTRFDHVEGELLWQTAKAGPSGYASGVNVEARLSNGRGLSQLGLDWRNQWRVGEHWKIRANALFDVETGAQAEDGVFGEARFSVSRRVGPVRAALVSYNDFGSLSGGAGEAVHQAGLAVSGDIGERWSWYAGGLLPVSGDAPDRDVQFRLGRAF